MLQSRYIQNRGDFVKRFLPSLCLILFICIGIIGCNVQSQSEPTTPQANPNPSDSTSPPKNTMPIKCDPCNSPNKPITTNQLAEIIKLAKQGKVLDQPHIKLAMTQVQIEALASSNNLKRVHDFEFVAYDRPYYTEIFFFEDLVNGIRYSSPKLGINTLTEVKKYLGPPKREYIDENSNAKEIVYSAGEYNIKFSFTKPTKYRPDPALYSYQIFEAV